MAKINCIRLNQDCSCFAVAHSHGFNIYNTDPVDLWVSRDFGTSSTLAVASILDRTNYIILVGNCDEFPQTKLILWNDQLRTGSSINYDSPVLNALVGREAIVAITEKNININELSPPHKLITKMRTGLNPRGVGAMFNNTVVIPACTPGEVAVIDIRKPQIVTVLPCHRSQIAAIAVNDKYIATASASGTLIKVYNRESETEQWLRRGLDRAMVYSLALSPSSKKLAVLSDKETLHVFDLSGASTNEKHTLASLPFAPDRYFRDEWSSARVKTRSKDFGICGWTNETEIIVLRPQQAQWEKYIMQGKELMMDAWKHIR